MGFIARPQYRWPNGAIPYNFGSNLAPEPRRIVEACMTRWEDLVARYAGRGIIEFTRKSPLNAGHGWVEIVEGAKTLAGTLGIRNLKDGCVYLTLALNDFGNIPHELGHIIGLGHEHARPDSMLTWRETNARFGSTLLPRILRPSTGPAKGAKYTGQRQLLEEQSFCLPHGSYDIMSIMHYECRAKSSFMTNFKVKVPVIKNSADDVVWSDTKYKLLHGMVRPQPKDAQVKSGKWGPSPGDLRAIQAMYGP